MKIDVAPARRRKRGSTLSRKWFHKAFSRPGIDASVRIVHRNRKRGKLNSNVTEGVAALGGEGASGAFSKYRILTDDKR